MTNTVKEIQDKLQKAAPVFTEETLELLWKWLEANQCEMYHKHLDNLRKNTDLQKKINDITRSQFYKEPQP